MEAAAQEMATMEDVYCTLVMSDNYLPGAAVLAKSLRDCGTRKKLACLIDQQGLKSSTVTELQVRYVLDGGFGNALTGNTELV